MTGYHVTLGYVSGYGFRDHPEDAWKEVLLLALAICSDPERLAQEAMKFGMPGKIAREYAQSYLERSDSTIRFKEAQDEETPAQIMQLASGGGVEREHKEAMRRAFCRLLLNDCHQQRIEININVA